MATYEIEITKRLMKTITVNVPDHVPADDVKDWVGENSDDVFDVEPYQGTVLWDADDLVDNEVVKISLSTDFEDHEYDVEGFAVIGS